MITQQELPLNLHLMALNVILAWQETVWDLVPVCDENFSCSWAEIKLNWCWRQKIERKTITRARQYSGAGSNGFKAMSLTVPQLPSVSCTAVEYPAFWAVGIEQGTQRCELPHGYISGPNTGPVMWTWAESTELNKMRHKSLRWGTTQRRGAQPACSLSLLIQNLGMAYEDGRERLWTNEKRHSRDGVDEL